MPTGVRIFYTVDMNTLIEKPPSKCSRALLGDDEPGAFEIYNPGGEASLVIVSDHANRRVPRALGDLGLADKDFNKHIAYDIGAERITRRLADRLNARAVMSTYSRLVIDVNRLPSDPSCIPTSSDNILIPGNQDLSEDQIQCRVEGLHIPYHAAINREIATLWRRDDKPPALFSVHSFTPTLNGQDRIWDIGVLWNRDPRLAVPLLENLGLWDGLRIGDNEPYSGRDLAYTINTHGGAGGLANCAVEIRQDHCATPEDASHWADILADALRPILTLDGLYEVRTY